MYIILLSILLFTTTIISIFTKDRLFNTINSGAFAVLIYIISEELWVLSLALLVFAYIIEYLIRKRKEAD